jgi:hypothetical protein
MRPPSLNLALIVALLMAAALRSLTGLQNARPVSRSSARATSGDGSARRTTPPTLLRHPWSPR